MRPRLASLIAPLLLAAASPATPAADRPNIVFIVADDLGWRDLGCYGSTFYETPNLDRLAARGMRFTDAYASCPVCSPTRASILTGRYPARVGITDYIPGARHGKLNPAPYLHELPLAELTIAEALKEAGYATAFVGKWHLGGAPFYPEHQGFDRNVAGCEKGSPPSYFSPYRITNLSDGPPGEYLTDRLTEEAIRFIEAARSGGRPFYLHLSHYAVHNPQQAKPELIRKYREKASRRPPPTGPEFAPEGERQARQVQNQPVYAAMIQSLDESVGRVLAALDRLQIGDETVVFFTSDNGGLSTSEGSPTSNVPLRAGKGWLYEGGVRVPLVVRWPGKTAPGSVGHGPA
ncbi:MAG TPA: sulfatase, partial [Isosphaeraceae bacterium]